MAAYHLEKCCTVGDAAGLAKNNMQAFGGEKWWNLLWEDASPGSPASRITDAITRQPQVLLTARDIRRHQMVVETATGEVVGYARWILPESRKGEWLDAQTPDVSNEEIKRFNEHHVKARFNNYNLNAMDKQMHLMMGKHRPKTFIDLDYLAVHPDHQQRGIASMLVKSGVEQADKMGIDIYLVATARNALGMYEKNGFEVLEESIQSLKQWGGAEDEFFETFCVIKHPSSA